MEKIIYFNTEEDLMKLTGLSHKELWDAGFDLDDWDYGFCCDERYYDEIPEEVNEFNYWTGQNESYTINHKTPKDDAPEWFCFWLDKAKNYYCHVELLEYDGKTYCMAYHA